MLQGDATRVVVAPTLTPDCYTMHTTSDFASLVVAPTLTPDCYTLSMG